MSGEEENNRIVLNLEKKDRKKGLKKLSDLVDQFLKGKYNDFAVYFEKPLRITENEFENLIGHYNSSRGQEDNGVFDEEYVYIVNKEKTDSGKCILSLKRLFLEFNMKEDNDKTIYIIHYAKGLSEKTEIPEEVEYNCNKLQWFFLYIDMWGE